MVWNSSLLTLCAISLNLCLDYSLSSISLQAYWLTLNGNPNWTGFVFGSYDGLTFIISPIISIIVGRFKFTSFRLMLIYAILFNLFGNVLYSIAGYTNMWELLFIGRLIAGSGAAFLPLVMVYVSIAVDKQHQQLVVGYIKYSSALARIIGPIIASILVLTPNQPLGVLFNVFTLPGWIAVFCNIVVLILIFVFLQNPKIVDEEIYENLDINNPDSNRKKDISQLLISAFWLFLPIWIVGLLSTFMYWMMMANGFLISAAFYHLIHSNRDLWKIYISGLLGFLIAFGLFILFKRKIKPFSFLVIATITLWIGIIFFNFNPSCFYYVAVGISTLGYALIIPSINVVNNLFIKKYNNLIGDHRALIICVLTIFQSIGRLIGASTFTWVTQINDGDNCDLSSDDYVVNACHIQYYYLLLIVSLIVSGLIAVCALLAVQRIFNRKNPIETNNR